jgi:hypothetical protein
MGRMSLSISGEILFNPNQLPVTGNHVGDAFHVSGTTYAWLVPQGQTVPTWIDP